MHNHMLEEMAEAIARELHVDHNDVLQILNRYWQDKIAHVWQVEDMLESAHRAGKAITRSDAAGLLFDIFDHLDSSMGISWTNLEVALEDYRLSLSSLKEDRYNEVHGVFKVWCKGDVIAHQFGMVPKKMDGNLPDALALAKAKAKENPGMPVFIGVETDVEEDVVPWLTVSLPAGETEPIIEESGESCTQ